MSDAFIGCHDKKEAPSLKNIIKMDGWKRYEKKRVFIRLKNGRIYTGKVLQADSTSLKPFFLLLLDKFGKRVSIASSEIAVIQEEEAH